MEFSISQSTGIVNIDPQLATKLNAVYNNLVKPHISNNPGHLSSSFSTLIGNPVGIPYTCRWAWQKLYDALPGDNKVISFVGGTINGENLSVNRSVNDLAYNLNFSYSPEETVAPNRYAFRIIKPTRGINNTFEVITAKDHELNRLKALEVALMQSAQHKLRLFKDTRGTVVVVTNTIDGKFFFQLFGMMPAIFPEIKEVVEKPENADLLNIFKAFYDCNADALIPYIEQDYLQIEELLRLREIEKVELTLKTMGSKQINALTTEINNLRSRSNDYYRQAMQCDTVLANKQRQLTGLEIMGVTIDTAALNFLKTTKKIQILSVDDSRLKCKVTTPITNFTPQDMESYYHNTTNDVTRTPWIAALLKEIFIDEKYQMVCTTIMTVPLAEDYAWAVEPDGQLYTGNPHLTGFECFTPARNAMNAFLQQGRILDMLNQLIATCASFNVVDGSVMRYLISNLKTGYSHNHKILLNVETGEMLTPAEYKDMFERT